MHFIVISKLCMVDRRIEHVAVCRRYMNMHVYFRLLLLLQ